MIGDSQHTTSLQRATASTHTPKTATMSKSSGEGLDATSTLIQTAEDTPMEHQVENDPLGETKARFAAAKEKLRQMQEAGFTIDPPRDTHPSDGSQATTPTSGGRATQSIKGVKAVTLQFAVNSVNRYSTNHG